MVSRKLPPEKLPPPQKIAHEKIAPYENTPYEYPPLWKLPPQKFAPEKIAPYEIPPHEIPSPLTKHTNESKIKCTKFFAFKKAVQHNILIKTSKVPFYTDNLTENPGLRYFLYRMKKIRKSNEGENRQMTFTCQLHKSGRTKTRQLIKFGKYVKLVNSQLSLRITLWI